MHVRILDHCCLLFEQEGAIRSEKFNDVAREIWLWCYARGLWVSAEHIPGIDNVIADKFSRHRSDSTE